MARNNMKHLLILLLLSISPALSAQSAADVDADIRALVAKVTPAYVLFPAGSGVCISADGLVLTNHHVAPDAVRRYDARSASREVRIPVSLANQGVEYIARPVGADPRGDIVLLKIDLKEGETTPFVELGDSDRVMVGDVTVAIGNPFLLAGFAFEPSVSVGVVSSTNRAQGGYTGAIQIDAALNPGNSGGPLFDVDGRLIGINGRILTSHGWRYNTGAGFAIPSNQIARFVERFRDPTDPGLIVRHGIASGLAMVHDSSVGGAQVLAVRSGSSASRAGLRPGDRITRVDGKVVRDTASFYNIVSAWPVGSTVDIVYRRGPATDVSNLLAKLELDVPVVLNQAAELPRADDGEEDRFIYQGLNENFFARQVGRADGINPFSVGAPPTDLGIPLESSTSATGRDRGLLVTALSNRNPEAAELLLPGDVITHVAGRRVRYLAELNDLYFSYRSGDKVSVTYRRGEETLTAEVPLLRSGDRNPFGRRNRGR